jgi:hypothetical protein
LELTHGATVHEAPSGDIYDLNMTETDTMSERRKKRNPYCLIVVLLLSAASQGCRGNGFAMVEGIVSLDGKALEGGSVTLYPVGPGPLSYSSIASDGSYQIRTASRQGVLPGQYVATVSWLSGPPSPGMTLRQLQALEKVPIRYCGEKTSDLHLDVKPGRNSLDLKLTWNK